MDELNSVTIGPDGPSGSIQNLFQLQDNVSKIIGKHTIKVGYHFTDVILTNYFIQRVTGNYEYQQPGTVPAGSHARRSGRTKRRPYQLSDGLPAASKHLSMTITVFCPT